MARIRNVKPEFFQDDELGELSMTTRLGFIGLWCQVDREGRCEDRPVRLKALIFPYDEGVDMERVLEELARGRFIIRYVAGGKKCIQIRNFAKHQRPHPKESAFDLPPPPPDPEPPGREISRQATAKHGEPGKGAHEPGGSGNGSGNGEGDGSGNGHAEAGPARACDPTALAVVQPTAMQPVHVAVVEAELIGARGGPPRTSHDLLWLYARVRSEVLEQNLLMPTGKARAKADEFLDGLGRDEAAYADIEGTLRLFFVEARGDPDKRLLEIGFGFGAWIHRFADLRERLQQKAKPAPVLSPKGQAFVRSVFGEG